MKKVVLIAIALNFGIALVYPFVAQAKPTDAELNEYEICFGMRAGNWQANEEYAKASKNDIVKCKQVLKKLDSYVKKENAKPSKILAPVKTAAVKLHSYCKEYHAHGMGNFTQSSPYYTDELDRDSDGIACEW